MVRFFKSIILLAVFSTASFSQTAAAANSKPDAAALLQQVSRKYAEAKDYHIEATEELDKKNDFSTHLDRSLFTAIMVSGKRYRFEAHTEYGLSLKVSDGKNETYYNADSNEYTQQPVQGSVPSQVSGRPIYPWEIPLQNATTLVNILSKVGNGLVSPTYLQDEDISVAGTTIPCYVINGKLRYGGGAVDVATDATYWIDKEKLLIRKKRIHREGPSFFSKERSIENRTTLYTVMEIGVTSAPDALFSLQLKPGAKLVRQFSNAFEPKDQLAGTPAPDLNLRDTNGNSVNLHDFHGKPVLLDFWATWCPPCIAALQPLKKLQEENSQIGLVVLGINEDDGAGTGNDFLAKRGIPWANFHDDGEIWRAFPSNSGLPYYVLIDADGQIVLAKPSAEESELRAAIAKLGTGPAKDGGK